MKTVQDEFQGGSRHIKTVIVVNGISDRAGQSQAIRQALQQSDCRIIRSSFTSTGVFKLFVESDHYATAEDLKQALFGKLPGLHDGDVDESAMGSEKMYLAF